MLPPNVRLLGRLEAAGDDFLEYTYLSRYFEKLSQLAPEAFRHHSFDILSHNLMHGRPPEFPSAKSRAVLIWLSDESSTVPLEIADRYSLILKSYFPAAQPIRNIHPFPLCGSNEVLTTEIKPFDARGTEVMFSGNLSPNRLDFFRSFTRYRHLPPFAIKNYVVRRLYSAVLYRIEKQRSFSGAFPRSSIQFTNGFRQGLGPADFAAQLANTKIALCPEGFRSCETIRHFEAMSLGCIVLACQMPPNRFYNGSPIDQLPAWSQLPATLNRLAKDPNTQQRLHNETRAWWKNVCSPEAMAAYTAPLLVD